MTRISGKTAFITGAASGIGLAISKVLARSGANVMLADIEAAALQSAREEVRKYSVEEGAEGDVEVGSVVVDVTDRESMADALETVKAAFGSVELLFNNAGVNAAGALDEISYEDWDWVLGVNLGGVINGVATFLPELKRHGSGAHMVNTASVGGLVGMRGLGVYNASKFAVVGLSEALRADMESYGVGVSVLCPGVVRTRLATSERNRPANLRGADQEAPEAQEPSDEAVADFGTDPLDLAEQVRIAVEGDEFYICTHPEFREIIAERGAALAGAFKGDADPVMVEAMRALVRPF